MPSPSIYYGLSPRLSMKWRRNAVIAITVMLAPFAVVVPLAMVAPSLSSYGVNGIILLSPIWIWLWGCVMVAFWFPEGTPVESFGLFRIVVDWLKALFLDIWFVMPFILGLIVSSW